MQTGALPQRGPSQKTRWTWSPPPLWHRWKRSPQRWEDEFSSESSAHEQAGRHSGHSPTWRRWPSAWARPRQMMQCSCGSGGSMGPTQILQKVAIECDKESSFFCCVFDYGYSDAAADLPLIQVTLLVFACNLHSL